MCVSIHCVHMSPRKEAGAMESSSSPCSCTYHDVEETAKIADYLIQTLAMACIEKTYANLFTSLLSVVDDTKSELVQYVSDQSICNMPDPLSHGPSPYHRAKHLLDQFVQSKTKFLSRVSSNVMSDKYNRIRQFSQELQHLDRWRYEERRLLAEKILRSVAVSSEKLFCRLRFDSQEELARHKGVCPLRPVICENTGCGHVFSALHGLDHDAICGFKLMPCVQACDAMVMRSMMEMHCDTTCPMKLVNCPFFSLGCINNLPQGMLEEHSITNVSVHLMYLFKSSEKQESVVSNLAPRMLLIEKALSISERTEAVDVGNLSLLVHQQDAKIKSLEREISKFKKQEDKIKSLEREINNLTQQVKATSSFKNPKNAP